MPQFFRKVFFGVDWILFGAVACIVSAGLLTMNSFSGRSGAFSHQVVWCVVAVVVFFVSSTVDWRFLKNTRVVVSIFGLFAFLLTALLVIGEVSRGAKSWFDLGAFAVQPADLAKLSVILILSKYFSRRHIEIANIRHILVSGFYVFVIFILVLLQPAFGGAVIIFLLWLGMTLVSGISKKHFFLVMAVGFISFGFLWGFVLKPFQKERINNFIHPMTNVTGGGYHVYQSIIAVGSGEIFGKGIGYGTQSKLQFLPEYQTDFIFAAFAEEWGFIGVFLLFILYGVILWRMLSMSSRGASNFETLFGLGFTLLLFIQMSVNIGMNLGLLPVTGNTLPFMSYGGSHLLAESLGLGIMTGMSRYARPVHKSATGNEMVGV
jgi:rod shape determining protein RodA